MQAWRVVLAVWLGALASFGFARAALAEPVTVTIVAQVPEGAEARPVSWSAVPMNLPPDADVLSLMVMTPEPVEGAWTVTLDPGEYLISGFTEVELYETPVVVDAATDRIEVPVLTIEQTVAQRCPKGAPCAFSDPDTGLMLTLPEGWAVDQPYRADLGDGTLADEISTVIFEDIEGDGAAVWFLNPVDWIEDDESPCRPVAVGQLCTFGLSPEAEAAFAVIAPSLALRPAQP